MNEEIIQTVFQDDLLNRKHIAKEWTESFLKNGTSKVIAVDAEWGMGKTYFATNWVKMLKHDNWQVCYIDAFKYDFTDDPFMVISHSIIEMLKSNNNFNELEDIANYLSTLFRAFKNNTIDVLPTIAEGGVIALSNSPSNNSIINGLSKIAGSVIKVLRDSFKEANNATHNPFDSITEKDIKYIDIVKVFKILIAQKANIIFQETAKPLVIIIDELDRCKPTFAIEFLEKIKHIFDVDNLVFVTFINHDELSNAVKGMYGESFNGKKYLNKFFNLKLTFPKMYGNPLLYERFIKQYLEQNIKNNIFEDSIDYSKYFSFNYDDMICALTDIIRFFQELYKLSLRDIENITELFKYMYFKDEYDVYFYTILRIIYLYNNELYNELKKFNRKALTSINDEKETFKKVAILMQDKNKRNGYGKACFIITTFTNIYDAVHKNITTEQFIDYIKVSPLNTPKDLMGRLINLVESICR